MAEKVEIKAHEDLEGALIDCSVCGGWCHRGGRALHQPATYHWLRGGESTFCV